SSLAPRAGRKGCRLHRVAEATRPSPALARGLRGRPRDRLRRGRGLWTPLALASNGRSHAPACEDPLLPQRGEQERERPACGQRYLHREVSTEGRQQVPHRGHPHKRPLRRRPPIGPPPPRHPRSVFQHRLELPARVGHHHWLPLQRPRNSLLTDCVDSHEPLSLSLPLGLVGSWVLGVGSEKKSGSAPGQDPKPKTHPQPLRAQPHPALPLSQSEHLPWNPSPSSS